MIQAAVGVREKVISGTRIQGAPGAGGGCRGHTGAGRMKFTTVVRFTTVVKFITGTRFVTGMMFVTVIKTDTESSVDGRGSKSGTRGWNVGTRGL